MIWPYPCKWDAGNEYHVGDLVLYWGVIYMCYKAVLSETSNTWISPRKLASHWRIVEVIWCSI